MSRDVRLDSLLDKVNAKPTKRYEDVVLRSLGENATESDPN
jgi:hypothetical protein